LADAVDREDWKALGRLLSIMRIMNGFWEWGTYNGSVMPRGIVSGCGAKGWGQFPFIRWCFGGNLAHLLVINNAGYGRFGDIRGWLWAIKLIEGERGFLSRANEVYLGSNGC